MDHFNYREGELFAEDVALSRIAAKLGTPSYVYSRATILHHVEVMKKALAGVNGRIFYSVKASSNQAILTLIAKAGLGMDVVSLGEYRRARAAGVDGGDIVFSGVGKKREELRAALGEGIYQFNVESEAELVMLDEVARALGKKAPIAFRINPDIDARTHEKISTGRAGDKFGINIELAPDLYRRAASMAGIEVVGVDMHIGSQLVSLEPFALAFARMRELILRLRGEGHDIARVDLGGGLGIPYSPTNDGPPLPVEYGTLVGEHFGDLEIEIGVEPGRMIMGNAGVLLAQVISFKRDPARDFLIIDAAMNDLMRPAIYGAHHDIVSVQECLGAQGPADVVGPVCETSDVFARSVPLPALEEGALVAIRSAGAYGAVMASEYNSRPLVAEAMVDGSEFALIRPRGTIENMINRDIVPPFV